MGSFVEDLWSSVFTPGATPTLLVATNVTFAALQTLLLALLLATYSIHFIILSIISGCLWYSINWFANELKQVPPQSSDDETQSQKTSTDINTATESDKKTSRISDPADSETETETVAERKDAQAPSTTLSSSTTASSTLQLPGSSGGARKRVKVGGDSSGYTSTDSEWEKVDDGNAT